MEQLKMHVKVADVVYCKFPCDDGSRLVHYCIVLRLEQTLSGDWYASIAYGSSKAVSESGHLPCEYVVTKDDILKIAGLKKPTRFDFKKTARLPISELSVVGRIPMELSREAIKVKKAAIAVM